ncbi:hypothetical protein BD779DRAFT_1406320, partial [Infundibulicybe gibba]
RRHISRECKKIALNMSLDQNVSDRDIRQLIGISERSMQCLRQTYAEIGEVERIPVNPGRPRTLDSLDACFLEACVERQPDMLLVELQEQLL